jgi:hypothetical protein
LRSSSCLRTSNTLLLTSLTCTHPVVKSLQDRREYLYASSRYTEPWKSLESSHWQFDCRPFHGSRKSAHEKFHSVTRSALSHSNSYMMSAENDSHLTLVNSAPSIEFIIEGIACRRAPFSDGELGHSILRIEHLKHRLRPGDEFPGSLQPHRGLEIVTLVLQGQFNTVCSTQHKQVMCAGHCQW